MNHVYLLSIALLLVLLNGFFVAAEFGLVKLRHTRVQTLSDEGGLLAKTLLKVHHRLDAYLSACQLGITLASIGLGWVGEPAFVHLLEPLLDSVGIVDPKLIHTLSFAFAFLMISYLHIVVGELAPKSMAIRLPEKVSLFCALPLFCFYWAMYPGIWLLNKSANMILSCVGLKGTASHDAHYSSDEIKLILTSTETPEQFRKEEWLSLKHMIEFADLNAADVMRPFNESTRLFEAHSAEENFKIISLQRFSRYPYVNLNGEVEGIAYLKDLYLKNKRFDNTLLKESVRPAFFVPPDMTTLTLLRKFREGASHFAIIGRKERPLGFVVLEDLLSLLLGEIKDEYAHAPHGWKHQADGSWLGTGSLSIVSLERALGKTIPHSDEVDSIGGLVMLKCQDIPKENDCVVFNFFSVTILKMHGPRIVELKVNRITK